MQANVAILLLKSHLAAWLLPPAKAPQRLIIQGQQTLALKSSTDLLEAFKDLDERLLGEGISPAQLHWVVDLPGRPLWRQVCTQLEGTAKSAPAPLWQNLSWEWIADRLGVSHEQRLDEASVIEVQLLPWLQTADTAAERTQLQSALLREHQTEASRLASERSQLELENERLRAQNQALQQVDAERLLAFLPALFPRVFTVLGAVDLALLCGRVEPLSIPNPYPEPSEEALHTLQKRFRNLPREHQAQIVRFVAHLPQRQKLAPRPEMRDVVSELEAN